MQMFEVVHVPTESVLSAGPFDIPYSAYMHIYENFPLNMNDYVIRPYFTDTLGI